MKISDLRFQPCNAPGCDNRLRYVYRVDGVVRTACTLCGKMNTYEIVTEKGGANAEEGNQEVSTVQARQGPD